MFPITFKVKSNKTVDLMLTKEQIIKSELISEKCTDWDNITKIKIFIPNSKLNEVKLMIKVLQTNLTIDELIKTINPKQYLMLYCLSQYFKMKELFSFFKTYSFHSYSTNVSKIDDFIEALHK
jgi:hypothetical protein